MENIKVEEQTLMGCLERMCQLYLLTFTKTSEYKRLYGQYLEILFSKQVTFEELEKAKNFLHTAPYSIGLNEFVEAMWIKDAEDILKNRDFFQKRMYIIATLPEKEEEYSPFLEKVEAIAKKTKELSQYICINLWEDYEKKNPLKNLFLESYKTKKGSLSLSSYISKFDDHGTTPNVNYSFIDVLKDVEFSNLSSVIFITDDPDLSAYLLGNDQNYSDHPKPAISQVLKENCVDTSSFKYGYESIIILDFFNNNFESY